MLAVLPILTCLSIFFALRSTRQLCWRSSFLVAALVWGVWLTIITELLSALRCLGRWPLVAAWGISLLGLGGALYYRSRRKLHFREQFPKSWFERIVLTGLLWIILTTALIAWVAPPNTWDSMTYHMSRVVHWIQNESVAYYPTHIPRQLHQSPWSEYAILHFQVLTGSDRLANFIQWASMVGSVLGTSLLAKVLGAGRRGQWITAAVCATIPMGILQSTSTQTDYVLSFWLVCFVYFGSQLVRQPSWLLALSTGAALGLAVLTKATAYVFAAPFILWFGLSMLRRCRLEPALQTLVIAAVAIAVNAGPFARNFDLYQDILGPGRESEAYVYASEEISLAGVGSSVLRNIALHLGTPLDAVNVFIHKGVVWLHDRAGVVLNDPRTTWSGTQFQAAKISFHEDEAGNLFHLLLFASVILLFFTQKSHNATAAIYLLLLGAGFVFFCGYLKWQPWHSRLHLPLFVLGSPFVGLVLSKLRLAKIVDGLIVLLFLGALPWLFLNVSRPLVGENSIFMHSRVDQYFRNGADMASPYAQAADFLAATGCSRVGLITGIDSWEYPLWVLLQNRLGTNVHIEHINVENASREKGQPLQPKQLCAVVSLDAGPFDGVLFGDTFYSPVWTSGPFAVYFRDRPAW